MDKLFCGKGPRITIIGGGTGLSVILRGLKKISSNLAAVVTMADDGGNSGMLREDLGMLPPGDIRSCLVALADVEGDFAELMQYRFQEGSLSGQNIGNMIIAALAMMSGSFEKGLEKAHEIFRINGRVIPVTCQKITLCAHLTGGSIVRGESNIPRTVSSGEGMIRDVYLEPENVQTWDGARNAIKHAEAIIIGPGSLYTSIIPNLLVAGIDEELENNNGVKILICNVMTQKGETDGFTPIDHVNEIIKYLGGVKPDYVLINNRVLDSIIKKKYCKDGACQVLLRPGEREQIEALDIKVIEEDFIDIKLGYIRHDADKIAKNVIDILEKRNE